MGTQPLSAIQDAMVILQLTMRLSVQLGCQQLSKVQSEQVRVLIRTFYF